MGESDASQSTEHRPIRVLHLEDNPLDAELIERKLAAECRSCEVVWTSGRSQYEDAIARERFDLILCDYNLPGYDGLAALQTAREQQPDTPVIMVTGTLSEDEAVECIKAGATDYMLKSRLQRLAPAVERALREAAEQRERRHAEAALRLTEERLQRALEAADVSVWEYDLASGQVLFSGQIGPMLGYAPEEIPAQIDAWEALTHPADVENLRVEFARHYVGESPALDVEYRVRARGGEWRWLHTTGRAMKRDAEGRATQMSGTHRDITPRHRADEMLVLQKLAIDAATNAIVIVDARAADYPIVHVNRAFERLTGYPADEARGHNCRFLQRGDRDQPELERLRDAIALGEEGSALLRNYRKDGTPFWNSVRIAPVCNETGTVTHFVGIQADVTETKRYQTELERNVNHDTLTGLANRNLLGDRLRHAIALAQRARRKLVLFHLDLNRFGALIESLGHAGVDELLKVVGARLTQAVRESDTVARVGEGRFAMIVQDLEHAAAADAIGRKILAALAQPVPVNGQDAVIAASIGAALYPDDGADPEALLTKADAALYGAKGAGLAGERPSGAQAGGETLRSS